MEVIIPCGRKCGVRSHELPRHGSFQELSLVSNKSLRRVEPASDASSEHDLDDLPYRIYPCPGLIYALQILSWPELYRQPPATSPWPRAPINKKLGPARL